MRSLVGNIPSYGADIVGGDAPGRASPEERTLFESQGLSVWDIATAARVVGSAKERGVGQRAGTFEGEGVFTPSSTM